MPLVKANNYFNTKSIKLSDSFIVRLDGKECFRCASFTVPKVAEWTEEEYSYGNVSQKFLIPKIDIQQELQLELYEGYVADGKEREAHLMTKEALFNQNPDGQSLGKGFTSNQNFSTDGYTVLNGTYNVDKHDYTNIDIFILDNRLAKVVYEYHFHNLKLTKAEPYELSYQDEALTKWSLGFVFESMEKGVPESGPYSVNKL